jgi:hypothetical protein
MPSLPVVVAVGESVANELDWVNVTVAPAMGVPRSFTRADREFLFPFAACTGLATTTLIVVGVDDSRGETCVLKLPT